LISGAKKTESKQRGLDRTVVLTTKDYEAVQRASHFLHESRSLKSSSLEHQLKRLQGRLATVTKKLWPRRKHRISLYSYRHLMGSDLKASGMSRIEIAAVMGHQSVDSVNVYGNRQVSQRSPQIRAIKNSISAVRKNTLKDDSFLRAKKKTVVKEFTFLD
jgi:integrase